jgi:hypothetical protein
MCITARRAPAARAALRASPLETSVHKGFGPVRRAAQITIPHVRAARRP